MASNAALRTVGSRGAGNGGPSVAEPRRPERHLRVLPPVPAAYAVAPVRRAQRAAGGAAPIPPAVPPRLRLTARGRRLVAVLILAAGVGLVALGDAVLGDAGDGLELMGSSSVVVERGDTLWSIAGSVAGGRDVREVVDRIQELNRLSSADIEPGQVLQLP